MTIINLDDKIVDVFGSSVFHVTSLDSWEMIEKEQLLRRSDDGRLYLLDLDLDYGSVNERLEKLRRIRWYCIGHEKNESEHGVKRLSRPEANNRFNYRNKKVIPWVNPFVVLELDKTMFETGFAIHDLKHPEYHSAIMSNETLRCKILRVPQEKAKCRDKQGDGDYDQDSLGCILYEPLLSELEETLEVTEEEVKKRFGSITPEFIETVKKNMRSDKARSYDWLKVNHAIIDLPLGFAKHVYIVDCPTISQIRNKGISKEQIRQWQDESKEKYSLLSEGRSSKVRREYGKRNWINHYIIAKYQDFVLEKEMMARVE